MFVYLSPLLVYMCALFVCCTYIMDISQFSIPTCNPRNYTVSLCVLFKSLGNLSFKMFQKIKIFLITVANNNKDMQSL